MYKNYCKRKGDQTMTCRDLLCLFKDLNLLDHDLTTSRLMKVIAAERLDPTNLTSCLDEEITFLEFLEVLFGCAELFLQLSDAPDGRPPSSPGAEAEISSDPTDIPTGQNQKSEEDLTLATGESQTAEHFRMSPQPTEEHDDQGEKTKDDKVKVCEVQRNLGRVNQFFDQLLDAKISH
ncbi:unnamed protein product [Tetraodon nigroviridis]|uniref:(spotted green pufferfish) hypothetical protein n=1 Tax=Tetraodon nigroviridis TaxID=99883 RepID=Q4S4I7_TETNG|nr:unnamed protein product [Tetraodon nigroviridis]